MRVVPVEEKSSTQAQPQVLGLSRNVFFLGLVSFLTDVSSEMIFTIMPLFLANALGVKTTVIGLIEGVTNSTATLTKLPSGWLSDRLRRRKLLTVLGYGLSTVAKPFLYLATTWGMVLGVRLVDRVGKGIRTAPRDALVADSTAAPDMGKSFGFHRALDSAGAVVGLAGAALIVFLLQRGDLNLARPTFQTLVLVGFVPAVLAVLLAILLVREIRPAAPAAKDKSSPPPSRPPSPGLSRSFLVFLGIMVLFTLGNSGDAFLILRAQNLGLSVFQILLVLILFNLVYTLVSGPAGILSDRLGRKALIVGGWVFFALIYLGLALATEAWQVVGLFAVFGLYYGATEGVARAFVADIAPVERRGTAYGYYHAAVGITALPASLLAGYLWQAINPAAPFFLGAGVAALAVVALASLVR